MPQFDSSKSLLVTHLAKHGKYAIDINYCSECESEFYTCSLSPDWHPKFCPYCGVEYSGKPVDLGPIDISPKT